MNRAPGESVAGFVPYTNELILSGHFQKKVITVNYDFPGYRSMASPNVAVADNSVEKNQIYYRETTSPGLYAPLNLVIIHAWGTTVLDIFNSDTGKLGTGATHDLKLWDNSASIWGAGGNDRSRYVSSYGAADSGGSGYVRCVTDGVSSTTPEADADALVAAIDNGHADIINYVIVDQAVDFRSTALPSALGANFAIDAIYVARINQRKLAGYDVLPSNFLAAMKAACQRITVDNPQI